MVNVQLFATSKGRLLPPSDTVNAAGAPAYALSPRHQLAQYAATGCLHATYYAGADVQLATVTTLCEQLDAAFIAKAAIHFRERGYMKDMPALLIAILAGRGAAELAPAFGRVVNNGKMLRNVVQILRLGAVGRKSLGTRPKKLVQAWLNSATEAQLLSAGVGQSPSLADVVKMVHPKPSEAWREAFFAWLIGRPYDPMQLPPATRAFEAYKRDRTQPLPDVPFQMLSALDLDAQAWAQIALQSSWQMVRMNLNTFARHGVFAFEGMTGLEQRGNPRVPGSISGWREPSSSEQCRFHRSCHRSFKNCGEQHGKEQLRKHGRRRWPSHQDVDRRRAGRRIGQAAAGQYRADALRLQAHRGHARRASG